MAARQRPPAHDLRSWDSGSDDVSVKALQSGGSGRDILKVNLSAGNDDDGEDELVSVEAVIDGGEATTL